MSRQYLLSYGKTFFLTAKLSLFTAKLTFSKQIFRLTVKDKHFPLQRGKSVNMAYKEDKVDDSIENYICNGFTKKYTPKSQISRGCSK